jgi:hypothetical protein
MPISSFREWQVTNFLENPLRSSNKSLFFFLQWEYVEKWK